MTVKLSWPWRMVGPALFLVAATHPLLVIYVEMRSLDRGDVLPPLAVFIVGVAYSWYCSQEAIVTEGGVVFRSWFRRASLIWSDIESIETTASSLVVRASTGAKYRVSVYARGAVALADKLRQMRPESARRLTCHCS